MKIERFEDIEAWQLARELTRKVYRLTKKPGFVMKSAKRSTVNREPDNPSNYKEIKYFD
ncbi:MAG: four helix bundle protein [Desulfobacteraceae bacterium]|nr:four helix bundle protein [Desulfobacteraceae bacterium]